MRWQRAPKYKNVPTIIDGIRFPSKAEAARYQELKLRVKAKQIGRLKLHPRFKLIVHGTLICTYVADSEYIEDGGLVVEDVKGVETQAFKIKATLFKALFPGYKFRLIKRGKVIDG